MRINIRKIFRPLNASALLSILALIPAISQAADKSNIRGTRYCEIIASKSMTTFAVYNTFGLNDCPESMWKRVNTSQVKKETGSSFVHLNGPRYWVIDGLKNSKLVSPTTHNISGLETREAGVLHLSMRDLLKPNRPYQLRDVNRQTTWVYDAGKPVFELIDPNGSVYVMQSYSVQTTPQTESSLPQLAGKLKLPKGWKFKTGVLTKPATVQAINNVAIVVQDDMWNTYQKASHDLL